MSYRLAYDTIRLAEKLKALVRYKPSGKIDFFPRPDRGRIEMQVTLRVPNVRAPEEQIDIMVAKTLEVGNLSHTAQEEDKFLKDWVRQAVSQVEEHEMNEWLTWDGERIREPHPEEMNEPGYRPLRLDRQGDRRPLPEFVSWPSAPSMGDLPPGPLRRPPDQVLLDEEES